MFPLPWLLEGTWTSESCKAKMVHMASCSSFPWTPGRITYIHVVPERCLPDLILYISSLRNALIFPGNWMGFMWPFYPSILSNLNVTTSPSYYNNIFSLSLQALFCRLCNFSHCFLLTQLRSRSHWCRVQWKYNLNTSQRLCLYSYTSEYDFGFFTKFTLLTHVHLVIYNNP